MTDKAQGDEARRVIAENRKARHDYHVLQTWEAGVALLGTEVKSIREGRANLRDSYARVQGSEIWLYNVHISPYSHRGSAEHAEMRPRKLLLHRHEIRKLVGQTAEKGLTLVPLTARPWFLEKMLLSTTAGALTAPTWTAAAPLLSKTL